MAVYEVLNKDIKTSGESIRGFINGLGIYREMGIEILSKFGIGNPEPGKWYPLQDNLRAYQELELKLGKSALFAIGEKVVESAIVPPEVDSIEKALSVLDIAFHMNHSIDGKVMFDPATGKKTKGIGNYHYKKINDGEAEITCDNPYPTMFDEGIISAFARKQNPACLVTLIEEKSSRSNGGEVDVYLIQWF